MLDRISHQPVFQPRRAVAAALGFTALLFVLPVSLVQGKPAETVVVRRLTTHHLHTTARRQSKSVKTSTAVPAVLLKRPSALVGHADGITSTVFALQYARAAEATAILKHAFQSGMPQVVADPRTNGIILIGTKQSILDATTLLTNLDQPSTPEGKQAPERHPKLFRLTYASADAVAEVLRSTVATRGAVSIAVDSRVNALVIVADDNTLATITKLLTDLDAPATQTVFRRVELRYLKPEEALKLISGPLGKLGILKSVDITLDDRTDSMVVTGGEDEINQVQLMVNFFDVPVEKR